MKKFAKYGGLDFLPDMRNMQHIITYRYGVFDIDFVKVWDAVNNLGKVDTTLENMIEKEVAT